MPRPLTPEQVRAHVERLLRPAAIPGALLLGLGATACGGARLYAAPMPPPREHCTDGADNDGDGAVDCADGDCARTDACVIEAVPPYAAPMPEDQPPPRTDEGDQEPPVLEVRPLYGIPSDRNAN